MYQSNLINDYLDTLFLCYSNLKYLIDINTTIADDNRVLNKFIYVQNIFKR